ncbi:MAG TPA: DinB family protein, partial [Sphingobacteriaceae bacterium]
METTFKFLDNMRRLVLDQIRDISIEHLNYVPPGFNNNIIWNFGHILVTQELLCYKLSGAEVTMPKELIERYNRGTKPVEFIGEEEYQLLNKYATSINGKLLSDYNAG